MSKNRVILEFFYKISELSELLYLVLLVLSRAVRYEYDAHLFSPTHVLSCSGSHIGGGGANHLHLLKRCFSIYFS